MCSELPFLMFTTFPKVVCHQVNSAFSYHITDSYEGPIWTKCDLSFSWLILTLSEHARSYRSARGCNRPPKICPRPPKKILNGFKYNLNMPKSDRFLKYLMENIFSLTILTYFCNVIPSLLHLTTWSSRWVVWVFSLRRQLPPKQ